ncbi:hypothetical protein O181_068920 [Austropuccinia psidii MF-1]|uniref:Uncharacterized protein n=1 Tax=Austropuccinia psidii MF-1 TaxID=1389203 RepID=A0A9Q3F1Y2_9BASI|nr:hypothetical protein [Austropuccinia psidii MF-1]
MKNVISKRDEVIAALMQQEEDEDEAKNNPWESNETQTKGKGKGQSTPFQNQLPQGPLPRSNTPKTTLKPKRNYTPNPKSTISVKRSPVQILIKDAPPELKYTKEELYVHIKLLWSMLTLSSLPTAPDKQLLKEFYQIFSSAEEVQAVAQNSQGVKLISEDQVQTLWDACSAKRKNGKNIINMQDFYITYVHEILAKLGIHIWAPDLQEAHNSLYNEACRIVALMTFQQIACSGAYQYMCENSAYCSELGFLCTEYDQYVHYVLSEKHKKEVREKGWNSQDVERKVVQRARQQFLVSHNYAKRYQVIASDVNAHSNDEYSLKLGIYIIKTLPYQSKSATAFFRRLHSKINEVDAMMGHKSNEKFNKRNHSEKLIAAELSWVAFVLVRDLPPGAKQHPDEQLGNLSFSCKYWESIRKDYGIEPGTPKSSEEGIVGSSIYLNAARGKCNVDNNYLEEPSVGNGEIEPELMEEENESCYQKNEDVLMVDAWDTRSSRGVWYCHAQK